MAPLSNSAHDSPRVDACTGMMRGCVFCDDRFMCRGRMWQDALCKATWHLQRVFVFLLDFSYVHLIIFRTFCLPELQKYSVNHCFNLANNRCRIHITL